MFQTSHTECLFDKQDDSISTHLLQPAKGLSSSGSGGISRGAADSACMGPGKSFNR